MGSETRPPAPFSNNSPTTITIRIDILRPLLAAADDLHFRFLMLPLLVDCDAQGWTVDGFTMDELHSLLGFSAPYGARQRNGKRLPGSHERINQIIEQYVAAGVIQTHPPRGHRRRFWFGYMVPPQVHRLSQTQFLTEAASVIPFPHPTDPASPPTMQKVSQSHPEAAKSEPGSAGLPPDLELEEDSFNLLKRNLKSSIQGTVLHKLLHEFGIHNTKKRKYYDEALRFIQDRGLSLDEVRTILRNSQAGATLMKKMRDAGANKTEGVYHFKAHVLNCLENGEANAYYLDKLAAWEEDQLSAAERTNRLAALYNPPAPTVEEKAQQRAAHEAAQKRYDDYQQAQRVREAALAAKIAAWRVDHQKKGLSPADMWLATMGQLHIQLPRATWETWVEGAALVDFEDTPELFTITVEVVNSYAKDWLEQRLYELVRRSFCTVARANEVKVNFVVREPKPNAPRFFIDEDEDD